MKRILLVVSMLFLSSSCNYFKMDSPTDIEETPEKNNKLVAMAGDPDEPMEGEDTIGRTEGDSERDTEIYTEKDA